MSETNKEKAGEISGFEGEVLKVIVTTNAVFTCSTDQSAKQHSVSKKHDLIHTFGGHGDVVYALAFDEKSQRLATGTFDGSIRIWNTMNGELILTFTAAPGLLTANRSR